MLLREKCFLPRGDGEIAYYIYIYEPAGSCGLFFVYGLIDYAEREIGGNYMLYVVYYIVNQCALSYQQLISLL
jgi:hypothetical protein